MDVTDPRQRDASLILFVLSFLYVFSILLFDSCKAGRLVISKNALRHLLDGLTFATGVTIGYGIYDPSFFKVGASNGVYTTVTAATCIFGPLINLADRYDRLIQE